MKENTPKPARRVAVTFAMTLVCAGIALLLYVALLLCAQAWVWLRFGVWQPLPMFSLFLSDADQKSAIASMAIDPNANLPLALVPSIGDYAGAESLARRFTGKAEGAYKIALYLVQQSLGEWSLALAFAAFFFAARALDETQP